MKILVVNGPNLGRLGKREEEFYGAFTLEEVRALLQKRGAELGIDLSFYQSDQEGELVSTLNRAGEEYDGVLINAGAYTHTSIAIRDALIAAGIPYVEAHISNVYAREPFRRHSYLAEGAVGVLAGFGIESYRLGLEGLAAHLRSNRP